MKNKANKNIKIIDFKKNVTEKLNSGLKNKSPLVSETSKDENAFVEKIIIIDHIKKHDLFQLSNTLVLLYAHEKDQYIKNKIIQIFKEWFESKKLNKIPKALIRGLKKNKDEYYNLFLVMADSSPNLFANRIIKLLNSDEINTTNKLALHVLFQKLIKNHQDDIKLNYKYFSDKLFKTTALLAELETDYLPYKDYLMEGALEKKMVEVHVDATITAELSQYYTVPKNEYARITFLLELLMDLKFFQPAAVLLMKGNLDEKYRIDKLVDVYTYINEVCKLNLSKKEKLEEIRKEILVFLKTRGIYPFSPPHSLDSKQ